MAGSPLSNGLLVFFGAGIGGVLRYGAFVWASGRFGAAFPWGTLGINALGSLAIGFLMAFSARGLVGEEWRLLVGVGMLGGFTTFSAFSFETLQLAQGRSLASAAAYVGASVVLSLVGCGLGWTLGRAIAGS